MDARAIDQTKQAIAYLFRRNGGKALSESALWRAMSFELKWLPPKDARQFAGALPRTGLVERADDGSLTPTFDLDEVKVPLNLKIGADLVRALPSEGTMLPPPTGAGPKAQPAPKSAPPQATPRATPSAASVPKPAPGPAEETPEAPQSPYGVLLHGLAELTGEPVPTWVERMNRTTQDIGDVLEPGAALLLAAARHGVDVGELLGPVKDSYHIAS